MKSYSKRRENGLSVCGVCVRGGRAGTHKEGCPVRSSVTVNADEPATRSRPSLMPRWDPVVEYRGVWAYGFLVLMIEGETLPPQLLPVPSAREIPPAWEKVPSQMEHWQRKHASSGPCTWVWGVHCVIGNKPHGGHTSGPGIVRWGVDLSLAMPQVSKNTRHWTHIKIHITFSMELLALRGLAFSQETVLMASPSIYLSHTQY